MPTRPSGAHELPVRHPMRLVGIGALPALQVLDVGLVVPLGVSRVSSCWGLPGAERLTWCGRSREVAWSDLVTPDVRCQERSDTTDRVGPLLI